MTTNNPFHYFILGLKKSADFRGRTRRRDFWYFVLYLEIINLILFSLTSILEEMDNQSYIYFDIIQVIFSIVVILPYFAVSIRRMHDINRSGWWISLPIVNIVFFCQDSDPQTNRFGPSPKPREGMPQRKENVFSGGVVSSDNLDKIEKLARLRDQGILTEEEFQRQKEQHYRLIKSLWAWHEDRIAVRFAYEWQDQAGQWWRSYGNENWQFAPNGQMSDRHASINNVRITEEERVLYWPAGLRPKDFPEMEALGL